MLKKYYKAEEIINILRQIEVLISHIVPMSFERDKLPRWQPVGVKKWTVLGISHTCFSETSDRITD